ncbi:MAG: amidohydrolase, partial [Clostridia bacterium]|nr:amidohydrolase [Clostridia bacterium]
IAYAGPAEETDARFDRVIDCRGGLLLPGFKNAHTHSAMTFLRSLADDLPLQDWLTTQVFPKEAQLTPEDVYLLTKLAFLEYLTSGITACFDMYYFREAIARAAVDTGFRTVLVGCANDYGGTAAETEAEYRRFSALHPLVSYRLGIHAEYTCSLPLLKDFAALVQTLKAPFYTHMNETAREVEDCLRRHGRRPFELLDSLGLFDFGGGGYHCVHLSDSEMEIMRARGLYAVTCPGSNMKLASGVAPLEELRARGVPVAIGTDGPASNNALDMFREMFLATGLQKLRHGACAMPAAEVLQMACHTGAAAMGLPDCDSLLPGKQADLCLIDLRQPNMQPENNLVKNLVYSGSKANVALTMVAGRVLYENGCFHTGDDPERLYAEAAAIVRRLA